MCGIAGFIGGGSTQAIEAMTDALSHRGPDDRGIYLDFPVALGHRRLSIVDHAGGRQPMSDPESGLVLVYNGEIYNHLELRLELEKCGIHFISDHSDTETVLKAFLAWGSACFERFNGMFAVAIYEKKGKKLWLARDRFGEKPLFYIKNQEGFAFASEPVSLRLWPAFAEELDEDNIQRFFAWNYLPGENTIFKKCKSLSPGSWLCVNLEDLSYESRCYWQYTLKPDASLGINKEEELAEELRRLLVQSVKRRMLSDVPLGIFLSGGLDSSAVLAAACQTCEPHNLNTFTIGFSEKTFDESDKASRVAIYLGVKNNCKILTESEMHSSIAAILSRMSEPFGDASLIPTCHLCAFAREKVTVALTGDGGDELLGGYDPLAALSPARLFRKLVPVALHNILKALIEKIPASDRNMSFEFRLKRLLRGLAYPEDIQLPVWMSGLTPREIQDFFFHPLKANELFKDAIRLWENNENATLLEQAFLFFASIYLPNDILVKSDRASMQVSLETRAIFLDNDLVDFCRQLPMAFKYRNGTRKYLLKKALEPWLPAHILQQPKKGFGIPLNRWLRSLPVPQAHIPGLKADVINYCYQTHKRRRGDFRYFLWDLQAFSHLSL